MSRDELHLGGPLPADTQLELIFEPTFHTRLGLRVTTTSLEWWQTDTVASAPRTEVHDALLELANRALQSQPASGRGGRDGMRVLLRTHHNETERSTVDDTDDDPVLSFGRAFLDVIAEAFPNPPQQQVIQELRRYLN